MNQAYKALTVEPCTQAKRSLWRAEKQGNGFVFYNKGSDQALDNYAGGSHNGNSIFAWKRHNGGTQIFTVHQEAKGLKIKNVAVNKCLKMVGNHLKLWDCNNEVNEYFAISPPNHWKNIKSHTAGLCIALTKNYQRLTQQKCSDDPSMMWRREGFVVMNKNGQAMDNYANGHRNGNPIYAWKRHSTYLKFSDLLTFTIIFS